MTAIKHPLQITHAFVLIKARQLLLWGGGGGWSLWGQVRAWQPEKTSTALQDENSGWQKDSRRNQVKQSAWLLPTHTRYIALAHQVFLFVAKNFLSSFRKEGRSKPKMTAQHEVSISSVSFREKALIQTIATWNWRLACEGLWDMVCRPTHLMIFFVCVVLCFLFFFKPTSLREPFLAILIQY